MDEPQREEKKEKKKRKKEKEERESDSRGKQHAEGIEDDHHDGEKAKKEKKKKRRSSLGAPSEDPVPSPRECTPEDSEHADAGGKRRPESAGSSKKGKKKKHDEEGAPGGEGDEVKEKKSRKHRKHKDDEASAPPSAEVEHLNRQVSDAPLHPSGEGQPIHGEEPPDPEKDLGPGRSDQSQTNEREALQTTQDADKHAPQTALPNEQHAPRTTLAGEQDADKTALPDEQQAPQTTLQDADKHAPQTTLSYEQQAPQTALAGEQAADKHAPQSAPVGESNEQQAEEAPHITATIENEEAAPTSSSPREDVEGPREGDLVTTTEGVGDASPSKKKKKKKSRSSSIAEDAQVAASIEVRSDGTDSVTPKKSKRRKSRSGSLGEGDQAEGAESQPLSSEHPVDATEGPVREADGGEGETAPTPKKKKKKKSKHDIESPVEDRVEGKEDPLPGSEAVEEANRKEEEREKEAEEEEGKGKEVTGEKEREMVESGNTGDKKDEGDGAEDGEEKGGDLGEHGRASEGREQEYKAEAEANAKLVEELRASLEEVKEDKARVEAKCKAAEDRADSLEKKVELLEQQLEAAKAGQLAALRRDRDDLRHTLMESIAAKKQLSLDVLEALLQDLGVDARVEPRFDQRAKDLEMKRAVSSILTDGAGGERRMEGDDGVVSHVVDERQLASLLADEQDPNAIWAQAGVCRRRGDKVAEERLLAQYLKIAMIRHDRGMEQKSYRHLAQLHYESKNYDQAEEWNDRLYRVSEILGDDDSRVRAAMRLGDVQSRKGRYEQASYYYRKAHDLVERRNGTLYKPLPSIGLRPAGALAPLT